MTTLKRFFTSGFWWMLFSALLFSWADILIKYLATSISTLQIAFVRFLLGGLILLPILSSKRVSLKGNQTRILLLRGLFGTLAFFCLLKSIAMIPLADAIVLLYTFPLFTVFFSFLILKAAIEMGEFILVGIGLLGIYIFISPDFHLFNMGYVFGLLSGCLGGLAMVFIYKARQTNGPLIIYFYFCLIGAILSFPFMVQGFQIPDVRSGSLLVLLALLLLVAQVLMNYGFKYCKASEGSLILMSEVVFIGIAGLLIFKDPVTFHFLLGAILIIGSGVGLNLISRRSKHSPASLKPKT